MKCKKCASVYYIDFDPLQGVVEYNCPLCGYPHIDDRVRRKKIRDYFVKEFKKLREGKENKDA